MLNTTKVTAHLSKCQIQSETLDKLIHGTYYTINGKKYVAYDDIVKHKKQVDAFINVYGGDSSAELR